MQMAQSSQLPNDLKVQDSVGFKRVVVDEDYADYKSDPTNLRRAYHLALGLFHLRDWTFWEHRGDAGWIHQSLRAYQAYLESKCTDFGYIGDLANSVKHAELDQSRSRTQMVGLANTEIFTANVAFQPGAFQGNTFQMQTFIVSETAPAQSVKFEDAADAVMKMWNDIFAAQGWK
jgi:hypothetical protein